VVVEPSAVWAAGWTVEAEFVPKGLSHTAGECEWEDVAAGFSLGPAVEVLEEHYCMSIVAGSARMEELGQGGGSKMLHLDRQAETERLSGEAIASRVRERVMADWKPSRNSKFFAAIAEAGTEVGTDCKNQSVLDTLDSLVSAWMMDHFVANFAVGEVLELEDIDCIPRFSVQPPDTQDSQ
jgi:hypothetical protein